MVNDIMTSMKNRVCFITVYFGILPNTFNSFLDSCAWNSSFDWLIINDNEINNIEYANIHFVRMNFEEFLVRLKKSSGIDISNIQPYKVCDYRPAFGEIFSDLLSDYEFWGIVDNDMLLGCLDDFITKNLLNNFDKIFTMGHLSLVRNNQQCNDVYKFNTARSRNYKDVFSNKENFIFDECCGFTEKYEDLGFRVFLERYCADVYSRKNRLFVTNMKRFSSIQPNNSYTEFCVDKDFEHQCFILDNGKIYKIYIQNGCVLKKEYMYIHKYAFNIEKKLFATSQYLLTVKGFEIDNLFFKKLEANTLTREDIDKVNRAKTIGDSLYEIIFRLRRTIRKYRKIFFPRRDEINL